MVCVQLEVQLRPRQRSGTAGATTPEIIAKALRSPSLISPCIATTTTTTTMRPGLHTAWHRAAQHGHADVLEALAEALVGRPAVTAAVRAPGAAGGSVVVARSAASAAAAGGRTDSTRDQQRQQRQQQNSEGEKLLQKGINAQDDW